MTTTPQIDYYELSPQECRDKNDRFAKALELEELHFARLLPRAHAIGWTIDRKSLVYPVECYVGGRWILHDYTLRDQRNPPREDQSEYTNLTDIECDLADLETPFLRGQYGS